MPNPAPGYARKPEHKAIAAPFDGRVAVRLGGETIADSRNALALTETGYGVVYYLPRADVRMDLAMGTERSTYCPFKGHASYFSFAAGDETAENVAWSYEAPYDEAAALEDHLAFYADRVGSISVE